MLPLSAPHRLIKVVQIEVAYPCQQDANMQSGGWGLHSALRAWLETGHLAQVEPPTLQNHRKGKNGAQSSSACRNQEDLQNWLGMLLFFLSLKNKTGRPGAEKNPQTDPERGQKVNTHR